VPRPDEDRNQPFLSTRRSRSRMKTFFGPNRSPGLSRCGVSVGSHTQRRSGRKIPHICVFSIPIRRPTDSPVPSPHPGLPPLEKGIQDRRPGGSLPDNRDSFWISSTTPYNPRKPFNTHSSDRHSAGAVNSRASAGRSSRTGASASLSDRTGSRTGQSMARAGSFQRMLRSALGTYTSVHL